MHPLLSSTPKTGPADPLTVSSVQRLTDPAKKIRTWSHGSLRIGVCVAIGPIEMCGEDDVWRGLPPSPRVPHPTARDFSMPVAVEGSLSIYQINGGGRRALGIGAKTGILGTSWSNVDLTRNRSGRDLTQYWGISSICRCSIALQKQPPRPRAQGRYRYQVWPRIRGRNRAEWEKVPGPTMDS